MAVFRNHGGIINPCFLLMQSFDSILFRLPDLKISFPQSFQIISLYVFSDHFT
jgi:hypothetical protein